MSIDPTSLSNNGMDYSFGAGFKVGYLGELFEGFTLGATFQSRTYMSKFDKYSGLFAEQGDFDVPMNWTIGFAYTKDGQFAVMADYKLIHYSTVKSIANPMDPMALPPAFLALMEPAVRQHCLSLSQIQTECLPVGSSTSTTMRALDGSHMSKPKKVQTSQGMQTLKLRRS